jgi:chromosome segregation ATPase
VNSIAQKFADYENEIRVLEAKLRQEQRKNSAAHIAVSPDVSPSTDKAAVVEKPSISRFGSFMGKRSNPNMAQQTSPMLSTNTREKELEEKLVKEQTTRIAAEKKVKEVNAEIEDLSATLFQQANEMVAAERKENAALKDRIQKLEIQRQQKEEALHAQQEQEQRRKEALQEHDAMKLEKENFRLKEKIKQLEQRETDRKRRIERLEAANRRIERVRAMLQPP